MAVHARLKNEFTEDEKCHNLMSWLKCYIQMILFLEKTWKQYLEYGSVNINFIVLILS